MNMNKFSEYALVVISIIILWIPTISMVLKIEPTAIIAEQKSTEKFPTVEANWESISVFPTAFKNYFSRNYGFRSILIKSYNVIMSDYLKNLKKRNIIFGKNDWMFWAGDGALDQYRAINPLTPEDLNKYKRILEEREAYCSEKGMLYLLVVPPNKHTIYPEYLPDWVTKASDTSYLDQLFSFLKNKSTVKFVDMRNDLISAKSEYKTFYKNDTHWTEIGALIGYQAIMKKITAYYPDIKILHLSDFTQSSKEKIGGDMPIFLEMEEKYTENVPLLTPKIKYAYKELSSDEFYKNKSTLCIRYSIYSNNNQNAPTAVMMRDSMADALIPFLSNHFKKIIYSFNCWEYNFDTSVIEHEKPNIVITEIGERFMSKIITGSNPYEVRQAYLRKKFNESEKLSNLGIDDIKNSIRSLNKAKIIKKNDTIILQPYKNELSITVNPKISKPNSYIMKLQISSTQKKDINITLPSPKEAENKYEIQKGSNTIFIELNNMDKKSLMQLDIKSIQENFIINNIEIRNVKSL